MILPSLLPDILAQDAKPDSVSSLGLFLVNHIMKETATTEQSVLNTSETWRTIIRRVCVVSPKSVMSILLPFSSIWTPKGPKVGVFSMHS